MSHARKPHLTDFANGYGDGYGYGGGWLHREELQAPWGKIVDLSPAKTKMGGRRVGVNQSYDPEGFSDVRIYALYKTKRTNERTKHNIRHASLNLQLTVLSYATRSSALFANRCFGVLGTAKVKSPSLRVFCLGIGSEILPLRFRIALLAILRSLKCFCFLGAGCVILKSRMHQITDHRSPITGEVLLRWLQGEGGVDKEPSILHD